MKNYNIIEVKYLGATNHRPSRVKMTSKRFEQSVTIDFDHAFNNCTDIAEKWLTEQGFNVIGQADDNYIITDTFKGLK